MKKHLLLLLSCSLLVGEASYASKRLREGDAASEPSEKRPRLEDNAEMMNELVQTDPDAVLGNPRLLDLFVEQSYNGNIHGTSKYFAIHFIKTVSQMEKCNPYYDFLSFNLDLTFNRKSPSIDRNTFQYFEERAQAGDVVATNALSKLYHVGCVFKDGETLEKDLNMATLLYKKGALQDHPISQLYLGTMFKNGWTDKDGVVQKPDLAKAAFWYEKAADQGEVGAQYELAHLHLKGWFDEEENTRKGDKDYALALLERSAKAGTPYAIFDLAEIYGKPWTDKDGVPHAPRFGEAHHLLCEGARRGHVRAQEILLKMYHKGWENGAVIHPADLDEAFKSLTLWAKGGSFFAHLFLGKMYSKGWTGRDGTKHEKDETRAFYWMDKSAKSGHKFAQNALGFMCKKAWWGKADPEHPLDLTPPTQVELNTAAILPENRCYFDIHGQLDPIWQYHPPELKRAFDLFTLAADQKYPPAILNLAQMYTGEWVERDGTRHAPDKARAEALCMEACDLGLVTAKTALANMCLHTDTPRAISLYKEAADQNEGAAQYSLGGLYHRGKGDFLSKDMDQALHYYMKSAAQKMPASQTQVKTFFVNSDLNGERLPRFEMRGLDGKLDGLLSQMEYLRRICHPKGGFNDTQPNEVLYQNMGELMEDMGCIKSLLPSVNTPGFMMGRMRTTYDNENRPLCERTTSYFVLDDRTYLCAGRENVQNGKSLMDLLAKLKYHPAIHNCLGGFQQLKIHTNEGDEDGIKHCDEMVAKFMNWNTVFNDMACDIRTGIQSHALNRAADFVKEMGL